MAAFILHASVALGFHDAAADVAILRPADQRVPQKQRAGFQGGEPVKLRRQRAAGDDFFAIWFISKGVSFKEVFEVAF